MDLNINAYSYNKGIEAFKNNDYTRAVDFMTNAMVENPWMEFIQAYKIRGFAYANLKDFKNALSDFSTVINSLKGSISENETIADVYFARGRVNNSLNNKEQAIEDFENCVIIDSNKLEAYEHLSLLYNRIGNYESQLKSVNKIIEIEPKADYYVEKADILYSIDKDRYFDEVISSYNKSIELSPNLILGYQGLASIYFEREEFSKAIDFYTKCIKLIELEGFYYNRGICYKKIGNINNYIADINKSSELGDEDAEQEIENNSLLFMNKIR